MELDLYDSTDSHPIVQTLETTVKTMKLYAWVYTVRTLVCLSICKIICLMVKADQTNTANYTPSYIIVHTLWLIHAA